MQMWHRQTKVKNLCLFADAISIDEIIKIIFFFETKSYFDKIKHIFKSNKFNITEYFDWLKKIFQKFQVQYFKIARIV